MARRRLSSLQDLLDFFGERCTGRDDPFFAVDDFQALRAAVDGIIKRMPGIGFFSPSRRLSCFYIVCRHFEALVERGMLSLDDAVTALDVLRVESRKFRKAARVFRRRFARERTGCESVNTLLCRCYGDNMGCL